MVQTSYIQFLSCYVFAQESIAPLICSVAMSLYDINIDQVAIHCIILASLTSTSDRPYIHNSNLIYKHNIVVHVPSLFSAIMACYP